MSATAVICCICEPLAHIVNCFSNNLLKERSLSRKGPLPTANMFTIWLFKCRKKTSLLFELGDSTALSISFNSSKEKIRQPGAYR